MEQIILDTNVVSELMRSQPEQSVLDWFKGRSGDVFYITAITQAEIMLGISLLPAGKRRELLAMAADGMFSQDFAGRCLPFDGPTAGAYSSVVSALRKAGFSITTEDAMIAAIALTKNYSLATRNTKDFLHIEGLVLHNPWLR